VKKAFVTDEADAFLTHSSKDLVATDQRAGLILAVFEHSRFVPSPPPYVSGHAIDLLPPTDLV